MAVDDHLVDSIVQSLNDFLEVDRMGISRVLLAEVTCGSELAEHPTIQVRENNGKYIIRPLGLLNGLCGNIDSGPNEGWGPIVAYIEQESNLIERFARKDVSQKLD